LAGGESSRHVLVHRSLLHQPVQHGEGVDGVDRLIARPVREARDHFFAFWLRYRIEDERLVVALRRLNSASALCWRKLVAKVLTSTPDFAGRQIGESSSSSWPVAIELRPMLCRARLVRCALPPVRLDRRPMHLLQGSGERDSSRRCKPATGTCSLSCIVHRHIRKPRTVSAAPPPHRS